jgi:RNA polymerase subunit RPABC4/transcription elongation factor Spt4
MDISWPGGSWETTFQYAAFILGTYAAALWVTIIYWTFRDIRQRTRDSILQAFSVLLVVCLFLPGLWIYLILRPRYTLSELYERSLEEEALLQELEDQKACPTCRRRVKDDFLVCPSCRTQLKELCRSCSRPLSYAWNACPYCGLEKMPRTAYQQRPRPVERAAGHRPTPVAAAATGTTSPAPARPAPRPPAAPDPFASRRPAQAPEEAPAIDLSHD